MTLEVIGAAIIVFLYLTQTEEKTKISDDNAITTLIIASAYCGSVVWASFVTNFLVITMTPLNPAIALGDIFGQFWHGVLFKNSHYTWIFLSFSFVGALLAVFLFEFVFKKAQEVVEDEAGDDQTPAEAEGLLDTM
jgi:glycerol uptake facilitator-like aquaporin